MIGFEVEINGQRTCLASVDEFGVLTAIVSWVRTHAMVKEEGEQVKKLDLHVGGLKELSDGSAAHITWLNKDLSLGDEIRMRIVNTDHFDEPAKIEPIDQQADLKRKRVYYEQLKSEFEND